MGNGIIIGYFIYSIMIMDTVQASIIPGIFRLATSTGLVPANPAQIIHAPAMGDMERPIPPANAATLPISIGAIPNWAALMVTALLKAVAAASPDPDMTANKNGP